ncbi:hypothetical protein QQF64_010235 [Cirrhinus molitorella]|uniref:Uncharacterized protein n=1 Tax=Cirrhinus molitorella TaxID=172907 RepID=A0ABR3M3F4_9TELE
MGSPQEAFPFIVSLYTGHKESPGSARTPACALSLSIKFILLSLFDFTTMTLYLPVRHSSPFFPSTTPNTQPHTVPRAPAYHLRNRGGNMGKSH